MIRSAYSPRERVQLEFGEEPTRTKQSFKAECDINNILLKFQRTGVIEHVRRFGAQYGFAPAMDFKEAMDIVARGKSMFESLPSSLRKRFETPEAFLAFVQDEKNLDEMRELGLAVPAKPDDLPPKAESDKPPKEAPPKEPKATEGDSDKK